MTHPLSSASYLDRHLGPNSKERDAMLNSIGYSSLTELIDAAVPSDIRTDAPDLGTALSEEEALTTFWSA